jgi:polyribonucleotide nucleotidyltransferase
LGAGKRIDRVEDVLELGQPLTVVVEDVDPNGKISLKPAGDALVEKPVEKPAAADEVEDGPGGSDDGSDADEAPEGVEAADQPGDDRDDAYDVDGNGAYDDDTDYAPAGPERVEVGFEAAFSAELEAVHGDLGVAVPSNRGGGGGRRRRGH